MSSLTDKILREMHEPTCTQTHIQPMHFIYGNHPPPPHTHTLCELEPRQLTSPIGDSLQLKKAGLITCENGNPTLWVEANNRPGSNRRRVLPAILSDLENFNSDQSITRELRCTVKEKNSD